MIWLSADFHFGHANIIKYCKRPFKNIEEMDKTIIDNINSVVKEDDAIIIVGDFSWKPKEYHDKIKCNKILVCGNHDRTVEVAKVFEEWDSFMIMNIGKHRCILNHLPNYYQKEFDFVICGHVHEKFKIHGRNVNIGVDQWDFKPISYEELEKYLNEVRKW